MDILRAQLRILTGNLSRILADGSLSVESIESLAIIADRVHRLLAVLVDVTPAMERNLPLIEFVINCLDGIITTELRRSSAAFSSPYFYSRERGRPKIARCS